MPPHRSTLLARALPLVLALAACGDTYGDPVDATRSLAAVGRLERGATLRIVARDGLDGDSVVSNVVVTPAAAGAVTGSTVRLLQAGAVSISARARDGRVLTTQLAVAMPPTVYFDGVTSGNRDIHSVSLDGGEPKRWTTSADDDVHPSIAGGVLAFASARDGNWELYSLPLAGGAERRLTTTAANETQPALSASGARIAFTTDAAGLAHVFVAPISLASPLRLTSAGFGFGGSIEANATWSPAGDRIVLVSTTSGRANLFVTPSTAGAMPSAVAGSGPQQTDVEPAWSPDGTRLVFASTRAGGTGLYLVDLATGAVSPVPGLPASVGQPGWLADGRLVFTSFGTGAATLWWIDPARPGVPVEIPVGVQVPGHPTGGR